jgi:hypothetical protein
MNHNYLHHIDQSGLDALNGLIGNSMPTLYSASLHVALENGRVSVKAYDVSIPASGSWVIVENDCEGYIEWIDCFAMSVTRAKDPHKLTTRQSEGSVVTEFPCGVVSLPCGIVTSVHVFEYREMAHDHDVRYDSALMFTFENGARFALEREDSIVGLMQLKFGADEIADLERDYKIRAHLLPPSNNRLKLAARGRSVAE